MKWISAIMVSVSLLTSLQAGPDASTSIPADSRSPFDFRGKPASDYPPYKAVFQAKTYGELRERLENFFEQWEKDKKPFEDYISINSYFHCKGALVRTCYLLGDVDAGDEYLLKYDPSKAYSGELERRAMDKGRLRLIAKQIQAIHAHLGLEDPFPKGSPKELSELYGPLAAISGATVAKGDKEPEEELEESKDE